MEFNRITDLTKQDFLKTKPKSYKYLGLPEEFKHLVVDQNDEVTYVHFPLECDNSWKSMRNYEVSVLIGIYACKNHINSSINGASIIDNNGRLFEVRGDIQEFTKNILESAYDYFTKLNSTADLSVVNLVLLQRKDEFISNLSSDISFATLWKELTRHRFLFVGLTEFVAKGVDAKECSITDAKSELEKVKDNLFSILTQFLKIKKVLDKEESNE